MLMDNVGPTGSLDNDGLLRALLQARKTPDPDCNISPAQVVVGRPIHDAFFSISRCIKYNNPSIRPTWREAWSQMEDAMRTRMPRGYFTLTARTTAERRVINTDQTTASDLGTTHICSVCANHRLNRGGADRRSRPYLRRHPPHQLHRLRYLHQYQPNHPPVFAQDDSLNHVATPYQKLGNGKNVDVRGALLLGYIPRSMIIISLESGGDVVLCHSHTVLISMCSVEESV